VAARSSGKQSGVCAIAGNAKHKLRQLRVLYFTVHENHFAYGFAGIGRIRLQHINDASADSLGGFVSTMVEPGSVVKTDDWSGYNSLPNLGYERVILKSKDLMLPHLVASLLKRWLLGTYQGAVKPTHLAYYLDEYTFRFNRRTSKSRGKLFYRLAQQAMMVDFVPGRDLKAEIPALDDEDFDDLSF